MRKTEILLAVLAIITAGMSALAQQAAKRYSSRIFRKVEQWAWRLKKRRT